MDDRPTEHNDGSKRRSIVLVAYMKKSVQSVGRRQIMARDKIESGVVTRLEKDSV
jgi:hypothetical protein